MHTDFSNWTLVFDLDGTLVETAPDLHAAVNHTLAHKGLAPVTLAAIRVMIGDGAKAMIRRGLSHYNMDVDDDEIEGELWPIFLEFYAANISKHSHPFEGCNACLEQLSAVQATLAVCTNKAQTLAEKVLSELSLHHHFETIIGGDALPIKKPNAGQLLETVARCGGDPASAIMVGDSETDAEAARNAGRPLVFVSFG